MSRPARGAGRRTLAIRAAAATLIVIGYADLAHGGMVIAPLALVAGYLILIPMALLAD